MAYAQQIEQQQEAQNYLPAASEYYYDQYSRNDESRFLLEKRNWKTLKQNNSSGKYLTDKELEYVALINGFLKNARFGVEYFTIEFLCSELGVTERHLRRIRKNTSHIFKTKWRKVTPSHKGLLTKVYAIRPTEHTVFLLGETNYYKSEYNSPVNNSVKSVKLGHQCPTSYNKDEKNINIRSRANFSNVKNSNSEKSNTELEEKAKEVAKESSLSSADTLAFEQAEKLQEPEAVETTSPTQPQNTKPREETSRPSNVVRNGFLGGDKRLSEIQQYLTDEFCEKLRTASGRDFTNQAIRQITKAIAVSEKGQRASFKHVNGILSYLTPALINEKRDAVKTASEHYYTQAGMTAEDKLWRQQENYLEGIEQMAIRHVSPENQFKGKLVGTLERSVAYNLLLAMQNTSVEGSRLVMSLNKAVELTERQQEIVLAQAQAVFNSGGLESRQVIERVDFVVKPTLAHACARGNEVVPILRQHKKTAATSQSNLPQVLGEGINEAPQLPEGIWGKVCSLFISQQEGGEALYKHWLVPLSVIEKDGIIELSTNSDMVRDRIEQTYLPFLSKVAGEFGINKIEIN